jgi:alpha/beta superfamily hydrolase
MKKIYSLTIALSLFYQLKAQTPCASGRYATDVFTNVTTTSNVVYGSNVSAGGGTTSLNMDIYQPTGDVETNRPLIIWAHGGSFIGGTKTDGDMVSLSRAFAKKGFVCASINYRLGLTPFDSVGAVKAVLRAVQDMKASIRFFYKDKQTTDTYKIDTNNIFIGGSSAGAITALHTAYLDKSCEVNYYINPTDLTNLGGMDGYSGNQCYSSKVKGVINLCGALGRYGWIQPGDVPFCSLHGTNDATVKYNRGYAAPLGIQLILLDGSRMLKEQANAVGVTNSFYTWYGKDHVPYVSSTTYMDSTVKFVRDFLITTMGCSETPFFNPNTPTGIANLYTMSACTTNVTLSCSPVGISELEQQTLWSVYPNPATDKFTIQLDELKAQGKIEIFDLTGKLIYFQNINGKNTEINTKDFSVGIYFIKINQKDLITTKKVIIEK